MRIHIIAIGGAIMHALALELQNMGHLVSGSDDQIFDPARSRLDEAGLLPEEGWFEDRITGDLDLVILGMHARKDNPELQKAQALGLPVQSFPEFLGHHWKNTPQVVVAGSHGKTTVTALLMHTLAQAGRSFDYLVGSQVKGFDRNVRISASSDLAVLEGDEYLSSPLDARSKFMHYRPKYLILTGLAWDHANVFPNPEAYAETFRQRLRTLEAGTQVYFDGTDTALAQLLAEFSNCSWQAQPYFPLDHDAHQGHPHFLDEEGRMHPLQIFGEHNLKNFSAVKTVCRALGISNETIYDAFEKFEGAAGRLEKIWETEWGVVYRDFAHAPSKVQATVGAVRARFPDRRLIAVLELHTYSSLSQNFLKGYSGTLSKADVATVFYDRHALELKKLPDLPPEEVARSFGGAVYVIADDATALWNHVASALHAPFVLLLMSSGAWKGLSWHKLLDSLR
ncbi:MAG: Mur ligase domain-containing protein [Flavobacteriales bacterium]|nr:Mur ligase domain-containing protein [Flavobacteriales bacterium]